MQTEKWIDMHCHILPGIDDGSKSPEMSLAMLRRMAQNGVGTACATSHYYAWQNDIPTFCQRRAQALGALRDAVAAAEDGAALPRVLPAAEAAFFSGISESPQLEQLCIENTRTLMLEMPFAEWNDYQIGEVTALVLDRGLRIVLVHPERFCESAKNRRALRKLGEMRIGLQVNADTLLHWRSRGLGLELLQQAQLPLLGSDCHDLSRRPPNLGEGRKVLLRRLGEEFLAQMDENAQALTAPRAAQQTEG